MAARFLFLFDFDETIINENSDDSVIRTSPLQLPKSLLDSYRPGCFLDHTQRILNFLNECGVTEDSIRDEIEQIPPSPGVRELLDFLFTLGNFECVILSDANSYFIESWLQNAGIRKVFTEVFTNPAAFDANGCLILHPFHSHSCPQCPHNLCKQLVLREYMAKRAIERGEPFEQVFYIGDGKNDICPTLALGQNDTIFPRKGFPMHTIIQQMQREQPGAFKPTVVPWERGEDVVDFLKSILEEK